MVGRLSLRPPITGGSLPPGLAVVLSGDAGVRQVAGGLLAVLLQGVPLDGFLHSHSNRFAAPFGVVPVNTFDAGGAVVLGYAPGNGRMWAFDGQVWEAPADRTQFPPFSPDLPGTGTPFVKARVSAEMPPLTAALGPWAPYGGDWDKHAPEDLVLSTPFPPQPWLDSDAVYDAEVPDVQPE